MSNKIIQNKKKGILFWVSGLSGSGKTAIARKIKKRVIDVRKMKKIKSYRGIRHMFNLPVRGQRTQGNFRKAGSVGVTKKK